MPVDTFSLWNIIKDSIDPRHEKDKIKEQTAKEEKPALPEEPKIEPSAPPMSIEAGFDGEDSEEELNPTDQAELEEEAARYHHDDDPFVALTDTACAPSSKEEFASSKEEIWIKEIQSLQSTISNLAGQIQQLKMQQGPQPLQAPQWDPSNIGGHGPQPLSLVTPLPPMSPLQLALRKAHDQGEDTSGFHLMCPVMEVINAQGQPERSHQPIEFKKLKELKTACNEYGPSAPFTQAILEAMFTDALCPDDWKNLAKACLSGGHYLLWKSEFQDQCRHNCRLK